MYALSNSNIIYTYDNLALQNICLNHLSEPYSNFDSMNGLLAHSIANLSSVFRCSNTKSSDFQESLIFDDYLKIISPGFAPFTNEGNPNNDWKSICRAILEPSNTMVRSDFVNSRFGKANFVFRGDIDKNESERILREVSQEAGFVDKKVEIFNFREAGKLLGNVEVGSKSVGVLSNSSVVVDVLKKVMDEAESMFKKRLNVHWYIGHGIHEEEILEATDLICWLIERFKDLNYFS